MDRRSFLKTLAAGAASAAAFPLAPLAAQAPPVADFLFKPEHIRIVLDTHVMAGDLIAISEGGIYTVVARYREPDGGLILVEYGIVDEEEEHDRGENIGPRLQMRMVPQRAPAQAQGVRRLG